MLTIFEQYKLRDFAEAYIAAVREAIKNKPVRRRTKVKGIFEATVDATGQLAESPRHEFTDSGVVVFVAAYIDRLIFGQEPGTVDSVTGGLLDIEKWMLAKGLDYDPLTVLENINRYGSSIWQEHRGQDSGLLADIDVPALVEALTVELRSIYFQDIIETVKLAA